ncbi:MAG TPA: hypothetical protein VND64_19505 [Pirellulales bacterium]|nr:hypothetical protein [Pirellulales bacterium]
MPSDYGGILSAVKAVLVGDTVLTDATTGLLNLYGPDGAAPSRANAIFYPSPPTPRAFPCVSLMDLIIGAAEPRQHDVPMGRVRLAAQVSVWGQSKDLRAIQTEIDSLLETAARGGAMDTAAWQFDDIDTSGAWHTLAVPGEMVAGAKSIEQRAKAFFVIAAGKG